MKLSCHKCEHRHCELTTSKAVGKDWTFICPLVHPEEGPVEADWKQAKDRGE
jgi:hypothetical protein